MLTQYYILQDEYPFGDVLIYPDTYLQNWGTINSATRK